MAFNTGDILVLKWNGTLWEEYILDNPSQQVVTKYTVSTTNLVNTSSGEVIRFDIPGNTWGDREVVRVEWFEVYYNNDPATQLDLNLVMAGSLISQYLSMNRPVTPELIIHRKIDFFRDGNEMFYQINGTGNSLLDYTAAVPFYSDDGLMYAYGSKLTGIDYSSSISFILNGALNSGNAYFLPKGVVAYKI